MDWLYRVFYTVFSLAALMILLFPVVAGLRFFLRNIHKRYTIWGWWIFFLRSICPVALSSALCMVPVWNRKYHLFLSGLGLTIRDKKGIMRSWSSVFESDITASATFKICSVIWVCGVFGILLYTVISHQSFRKELRNAKMLGENIYESAMLSEPARLGFFHVKIYLPEGFQPKEMAWLLRHMEQHRSEGIMRVFVMLIMACHWFNPVMWLYYYWWSLDMEMAADDRTVYRAGKAERKEYAQGILNFTKDSKIKNKTIGKSAPFLGFTEKNTEKRAYRMLYQKKDKINDRLTGMLWLSLAIILCFLLRPMQMAWSGDTLGNEEKQTEKGNLFGEKDTTVVAKMGTKSPEGLKRVLQLEMVRGTESEAGYDGTFVLKMYDMIGDELASCKVEDIFPQKGNGTYHFAKDITLCISDYNGDNIQELVIGQQTEADGKAGAIKETASVQPEETTGVENAPEYTAYSYALVNIENKKLSVLCQDIVAVQKKGSINESISFEKPEKIDDIFMVPSKDETLYYVWNEAENTYEEKAMTEDALEAHRQNADEQTDSGETKEHTLENSDGTVAVLVSTKQDSTQSEEIQSVTLFPRGASKKLEDIHGYFCDLLWLDEEERYAYLIYNGTKSQTFVVFDTKSRKIYYQHEDGTEKLAAVFKQYKEEDITFQDGGVVVYELAEKKEDVLKINFVAEADNGVTVKGSYEYNVVKRMAFNLSFSRNTG